MHCQVPQEVRFLECDRAFRRKILWKHISKASTVREPKSFSVILVKCRFQITERDVQSRILFDWFKTIGLSVITVTDVCYAGKRRATFSSSTRASVYHIDLIEQVFTTLCKYLLQNKRFPFFRTTSRLPNLCRSLSRKMGQTDPAGLWLRKWV